jgi:hypothetical protein
MNEESNREVIGVSQVMTFGSRWFGRSSGCRLSERWNMGLGTIEEVELEEM